MNKQIKAHQIVAFMMAFSISFSTSYSAFGSVQSLTDITDINYQNSNINKYIERIPSSIDRAASVIADPSNAFEKGQLLSIELIQTYHEVKKAQNLAQKQQNIISQDAKQFVGKNTNEATLLMADKYAHYWWNQSEIKTSTIGRPIELMENGLNNTMVLGKDEKIKHQFNLSMGSFATQAKLGYQGYFDAAVSYQALDASSQVELSEKIWDEKSLTLSHTKNSTEQRSAIQLSWSW